MGMSNDSLHACLLLAHDFHRGRLFRTFKNILTEYFLPDLVSLTPKLSSCTKPSEHLYSTASRLVVAPKFGFMN
jgi:hypothetical protein